LWNGAGDFGIEFGALDVNSGKLRARCFPRTVIGGEFSQFSAKYAKPRVEIDPEKAPRFYRCYYCRETGHSAILDYPFKNTHGTRKDTDFRVSRFILVAISVKVKIDETRSDYTIPGTDLPFSRDG